MYPDIFSVVAYVFEWSSTALWTFNAFGIQWSISFLTMFTMLMISGLSIRVIRWIYWLACDW